MCIHLWSFSSCLHSSGVDLTFDSDRNSYWIAPVHRIEAMMSRIHVLAVALAVYLTLTLADPIRNGDNNGVDRKAAARQMVSDIRRMAIQAKDGIYIKALRKDVLDLQSAASDLITDFPGEVSECDVQSTIKMAASRTGSHEVLTVLLASDALSVLNGRLSLALGFLEQVALLMEDELSLTADVGPHLTAVVFGTNVTLDIVDMADKTVKAMVPQTADDQSKDGKGRDRRSMSPTWETPSPPRIELPNGWSVGSRGLQWDSDDGAYSFNVRPTFRGFEPDGFRAGFTIRF